MGYFVIEIQKNEGVGSAIPIWYATEAEAQSNYHRVLSIAALSTIDVHGAICIQDDLRVFERKIYDRTTDEQTEEDPIEDGE